MRPFSRPATRLLAGLLLVPLLPLPGLPGAFWLRMLAPLRTWWLARQVEAAAARGDARLELELAASLLRLGGPPAPFLLALHRVGLDLSAPRPGIPPSESLAAARRALTALSQARTLLPDSRRSLLLHEFLVARRVLPLAGPEEALRVSWMPTLLAAGGPGLEPDPAAYRVFLELDPDRREEVVLAGLHRLGP